MGPISKIKMGEISRFDVIIFLTPFSIKENEDFSHISFLHFFLFIKL
ncbi:hypothetical protein Mmah_1717 [Methanohalophilus mahii DSM 5219]|uniref:Uncharacterized protein n=1 Tax=Methanohalophilus mahii (strain ATCC 35705 / DSM 5219 / SLP) TaxID=547558 RepID=D5E7S4_METMS|nr:hypothetical protein Mmah_1717 [Methanohalophilus mahii DSM 5219]